MRPDERTCIERFLESSGRQPGPQRQSQQRRGILLRLHGPEPTNESGRVTARPPGNALVFQSCVNDRLINAPHFTATVHRDTETPRKCYFRSLGQLCFMMLILKPLGSVTTNMRPPQSVSCGSASSF